MHNYKMASLIKDSIETGKQLVNKFKSYGRDRNSNRDYYDAYDNDYDYGDVEPDNSRYEIEYSDILDRYEHTLKNERQDQNGKWNCPKGVKPKLNEIGVADILSDLRAVMHKGTALGNIDDNYAKAQTKSMSKAFSKKLVYNTIRWDVERSQRKSLVLSYANQVYMTLTRPVGDKERIHRSKKYPMQEVYRHDEVRPDEIRM